MSLISSSVAGLEVREYQVSPVSITHQPITIKGETDVYLSFGKFQTTWKFLVVENTSESVLGADFIDSHHTESWGISNGKLWLDKAEIPLAVENKCAAVTLDSYAPVVARCTVELQARHQVLISMRCKEIRVFSLNLLEPQGVLLSKTLISICRHGDFWVKAVNLSQSLITLYTNQKLDTVTAVDSVSEHLSEGEENTPLARGVTQSNKAQVLNNLGIDLSDSSAVERDKLENFLMSFTDVFSGRVKEILENASWVSSTDIPVATDCNNTSWRISNYGHCRVSEKYSWKPVLFGDD